MFISYVYFNEINTDSNGEFTNKDIDFLPLPKKKESYMNNLKINAFLQEDITKFKNFKDIIKNNQIYIGKLKLQIKYLTMHFSFFSRRFMINKD